MEYGKILSEFAGNQSQAKRDYRKHVEEGFSQEPQGPLATLRERLVLGGEKSIDKIKELLGGEKISREIPERCRFIEAPSPDRVIKAVLKAFGVKEGEIQSKKSRSNTARKVDLYLVQRYSEVGNNKVEKLSGGIQYSAVSKYQGS